MKYRKEIVEYIKVNLETTQNESQLARKVIREFGLDRSLDGVRKKIFTIKEDLKIVKEAKPIKRLFFDIETSYLIVKLWRVGKQDWVNATNIIQDKKIICISYKWQYENDVHRLTWDKDQNDKKMIKEFIEIMGEADEIVGHNGDRFDIKELRTRAIQEGVLMFPTYRTLDTLKKARKYFNFNSNKLDYLGQIFDVGRKLDHEGMPLWDNVMAGSKKALKKMGDYCDQDVILLEDVFQVLMPYIDHNTNFAVLKGGKKWQCPECSSEEVKLSHTDTTPRGYIKRHMSCKCKKNYPISNMSYMNFLKHNFSQ